MARRNEMAPSARGDYLDIGDSTGGGSRRILDSWQSPDWHEFMQDDQEERRGAAQSASPPDGVPNVAQSPSSSAIPGGPAQPAEDAVPPPPAALTDVPAAEEDRYASGQDTFLFSVTEKTPQRRQEVAQRLWLLARGAAQPAMPGAAATQPDVPRGGAAQPAVPGGGPAQPAVPGGGAALLFTQGHLQEAANSRQNVGCDVARVALQTLLRHHHGERVPGAVDITDGAVFDWLPCVACIEGAPDVIRDGVRRVYVVRWQPDGAPEAVFCYSSNMYSTLMPRTARCTGSCRTTRFRLYTEANWMTEPLLSAAPVAAEPWLVLQVREVDDWMTKHLGIR